ncbi:hypothetical protein [Candidatus Anaplasma sp. TIGMIC]|uniref:hypothetical protein n=1 Tax=Candidatus Anaplasma sp. TIGMIC TaxID=3020713 RepID=UPI00233111D8|nr:hypothetical protein [Candidatus Anaplasma sp. TIGMIC]MDB1135456.1 hypothetical protein [Candidatus Anaplasma sp. TIGMIC]
MNELGKIFSTLEMIFNKQKNPAPRPPASPNHPKDYHIDMTAANVLRKRDKYPELHKEPREEETTRRSTSSSRI